MLHLNSLGKDSLVCLEWLATYARPAKIYSLFFKRFTLHPDEARYFAWLRARYPDVEFLTVPDPLELNHILNGLLQPPERVWAFDELEYDYFSKSKMLKEITARLAVDFLCDGTAGYEGMGRAQKFLNAGLLQGQHIYPIGLMKKREVVGLIKQLGLKLNPTYRHYTSTFDEVSYYRMRSAMRRNSDYRALLFAYFPLLKLDEYRWEHLINVKGS